MRAQRDLCAAFFAGDVERVHAGALQRINRLQQQGRFANAGVTANEHHAAFNHAAAEHAVELFLAGGVALHIDRFDLRQRCDFGGGCQALRQRAAKAVFARGASVGNGFNQGVPGAAAGAFAHPAWAAGTAFGAAVSRLVFGHDAKCA